jgi:hypothetical protein
LETRAVDLPGLAAHATAVAAVTPVLDYVAIIAIMQCVAKIVVVLGAGTVALVTNNQERRDACLKLVEIVWHNWTWPFRLPGSQA